MKNTLIALATAGIIASGSVAADTTTVQVNGSAAIVPATPAGSNWSAHRMPTALTIV